MKTNPGNFFEDFVAGAKLVHAVPRTITEGDQSLYVGLTGDRYPLHCSAEFARSLGYRRETVNDLLAFHMVFGKTVNDVSLNAVANLGYAAVRFLEPVYPGDTVRSVSEVIGKKENKSGENGVVWVKSTGTNQRGAKVRAEVPPTELTVPRSLYLGDFEPWASGGRAFFDDYTKGEKIDHVDGMTIEESEHAIATRLYQNTAKVHFDGFAAKNTRFGKRLIYGGHVISLARSLAFNGLENVLGILAWNGGAHANPTFAGDTLYAWSEVLDKADLPDRVDAGALRLRLVGVKNLDLKAEPFPLKIEKDGKSSYHPNVVLDLDYWVLVPKKR
jgi:2-methylfumaryl-CoA hydratase